MSNHKALIAIAIGMLVTGCSRQDPAPPSDVERIQLAYEDSARYTKDPQCLPATQWPVIMPATDSAMYPRLRDPFEDLYAIGLVTRTTKLLPKHAMDGTAYTDPIFVYELTPAAKPFVRNSTHDGQEMQAVCFAPLKWTSKTPVRAEPFVELTGIDFIYHDTSKLHDAIPTDDGKGAIAMIVYELTPEDTQNEWEQKLTTQLGGDASFMKKNDDAMSQLYDLVYADAKTIKVTVENRGSGWKITRSEVIPTSPF